MAQYNSFHKMNRSLFLLFSAILLSFTAHADEDNIVYRVNFLGGEKRITKQEIGKKNYLTVFEISELCFGKKFAFDTVVFNVSDIVGSTKIAKSKLVLKKDDWKVYEIKLQSQLYFYTSAGKEP